MNRTRYPVQGRNSVNFRTSDTRLGPVSNTIILIVLACVLGLVYLTQVTKTNAYGYQISNLQQQQTQLNSDHNNLEVAAARLQSLSRAQDSGIAKNLVSVAPSDTIQN